jgi:hypothetical protein
MSIVLIRSPRPGAHSLAQGDHRVRASEGRAILVSQDECSHDRQPGLACAYAPTRDPVRAERSLSSNTRTRIAGVLHAHTGDVHAISGSKVGSTQLVEL